MSSILEGLFEFLLDIFIDLMGLSSKKSNSIVFIVVIIIVAFLIALLPLYF